MFYDILRLLYIDEEADVVIKMPYALATIERIAASTGYDPTKLQHILDRLTTKGLVIDIFVNNAYHYTPSPIVVGIFEFTMMRTAVVIRCNDLKIQSHNKYCSNAYLHGLYDGKYD